MKLLVSKTGRVYAAGPKLVRQINRADIVRRIKEECQQWKLFSET